MQLRAGVGLLCAVLAGCQHLPEGVKIDLHNQMVEVGPCRCRLPGAGAQEPAGKPKAAPAAEPVTACGVGAVEPR